MRVGLTGAIGAGKSVAAGRFAELGAVVVDHDLLAREAVRPGTVGLAEVVEAFGEGVLRPDGTLDRGRLAAVVFADAGARRRLEAVVHPQVRRLAAERDAAVLATGRPTVVVHDIPLLVETGQADHFGLLVVVDAPPALCRERLVAERGMDPAEADARIAAQADRETRLAAADEVLDGSGSVEALRAQVDALWPRLVAMAEAELEQA